MKMAKRRRRASAGSCEKLSTGDIAELLSVSAKVILLRKKLGRKSKSESVKQRQATCSAKSPSEPASIRAWLGVYFASFFLCLCLCLCLIITQPAQGSLAGSSHVNPAAAAAVAAARVKQQRIVRLSGQQARFECQLSAPLAAPPSVAAARGVARVRSMPEQRRRRMSAGRGGAAQGGGDAGQLPVAMASKEKWIDLAGTRSGRGLTSALNDEDEEQDDNFGTNLESRAAGDSVELILWYHLSENQTTLGQPIYSVDARQAAGSRWPPGGGYGTASFGPAPMSDQAAAGSSSPLIPVPANAGRRQLNYTGAANESTALVNNVMSKNAKHYASAGLSQRLRLEIAAGHSPPSAYLIIDQLELADAGQYKCRVDYKFARTSYQLSRLDVIVPLTEIQIRATDARGIDLLARADDSSEVVEEVNEDETMNLECLTENNGWPHAQVAWWRVDWPQIASKSDQTKPLPTSYQLTQLACAENIVQEPARQLISVSAKGEPKAGDDRECLVLRQRLESRLAAATKQRLLKPQVGSIGRVLAGTLQRNDHTLASNELQSDSDRQSETVPGNSSADDGEMVQFLRQNRLVLYACGASNTMALDGELESLLDKGQRDKLARVGGPIFRSILVKPNVPPSSIQMFLVGRRHHQLRRQEKELELTPLANEQSVHLNLATLGAGEEPQLQFVCQLGGYSQPEARFEWMKLGGGAREGILLAPEATLVAAQNSSASNNLLRREQQRSSLRLRNISTSEHQTIIKCSALNEKFDKRRSVLNPDLAKRQQNNESLESTLGRATELSTSIKLNITHVPLVNLQLELARPPPPPLIDSGRAAATQVLKARTAHKVRNVSVESGVFNSLDEDYQPHLEEHNASKQSGEKVQVLPLLVNTNVTLACEVAFANPAILGPIEWLLNGTDLNDPLQRNGLVSIVEKAQVLNKPQYIERLVLQFTSASLDVAHLSCKARNEIGQAASNELNVLIGRQPRCTRNALERTGEARNLDTTDKSEGFVQCPVISDAQSSVFHWISVPTNNGNPDAEAATTKTTVLLSSKKNSLQLSLIANDNLDELACFASDKFGSNDKAPCLIKINPRRSILHLDNNNNGQGQSSSLYNGGESSLNLLKNCGAKLVADRSKHEIEDEAGGEIQKRQHAEENQSYSNQLESNQPGNGSNDDSQLLSLINHQQQKQPPTPDKTAQQLLYLLTIECEPSAEFKDDVGFSIDGLLVHFDLYLEQDTAGNQERRFIKRLLSVKYSQVRELLSLDKLDNNDENDDGEEQLVVLVNSSLPLNMATIDRYSIVASITESHNQSLVATGFPNVTLTFRLATAADKIGSGSSSNSKRQAVGKFPRTIEQPLTGQRDRLWLVSSIVAVFLASSVLVIIAWACRGYKQSGTCAENQTSNEKKGVENLKVNSIDGCKAVQQTEMYLVGEELSARPTIYHNAPQQERCKQTESLDNTATLLNAAEPFIDHHQRRFDHLDQLRYAATASRLSNNSSSIVEPTLLQVAADTRLGDPCDFLIISPTVPISCHEGDKGQDSVANTLTTKQQATVMFLDQPLSGNNDCLGASRHPLDGCATFAEERALTFASNQNNAKRFEILSQRADDEADSATFRAACCCDLDDGFMAGSKPVHNQPRSSSSNSGNSATTTTGGVSQLQFFPQIFKPTSARLPQAGMHELNSQGDLTMTDESGSFVHEDLLVHGNTGARIICEHTANLQQAGRACYECQRLSIGPVQWCNSPSTTNSSRSSHQHQHQHQHQDILDNPRDGSVNIHSQDKRVRFVNYQQ